MKANGTGLFTLFPAGWDIERTDQIVRLRHHKRRARARRTRGGHSGQWPTDWLAGFSSLLPSFLPSSRVIAALPSSHPICTLLGMQNDFVLRGGVRGRRGNLHASTVVLSISISSSAAMQGHCSILHTHSLSGPVAAHAHAHLSSVPLPGLAPCPPRPAGYCPPFWFGQEVSARAIQCLPLP